MRNEILKRGLDNSNMRNKAEYVAILEKDDMNKTLAEKYGRLDICELKAIATQKKFQIPDSDLPTFLSAFLVCLTQQGPSLIKPNAPKKKLKKALKTEMKLEGEETADVVSPHDHNSKRYKTAASGDNNDTDASSACIPAINSSSLPDKKNKRHRQGKKRAATSMLGIEIQAPASAARDDNEE